jgi:hypothetical protein
MLDLASGELINWIELKLALSNQILLCTRAACARDDMLEFSDMHWCILKACAPVLLVHVKACEAVQLLYFLSQVNSVVSGAGICKRLFWNCGYFCEQIIDTAAMMRLTASQSSSLTCCFPCRELDCLKDAKASKATRSNTTNSITVAGLVVHWLVVGIHPVTY